MRKSRARSTCREDRVIRFAKLPKGVGPRGGIVNATDQELRDKGIHIYDRGSTSVQAICNGYWDRERRIGVDAQGDPWPGILVGGRTGIYRAQRLELKAASLRSFEDGQSGGRQRLMLDKRPEEFDRTFPNTDRRRRDIVIAAVELTEDERLARALPRIFGDA